MTDNAFRISCDKIEAQAYDLLESLLLLRMLLYLRICDTVSTLWVAEWMFLVMSFMLSTLKPQSYWNISPFKQSVAMVQGLFCGDELQ